MQCFKEIWDRACLRKGGQDELEALMPAVENAKKLRAIADDRWLSNMTKRIFQAGFVWKVIENKWDDFEEAFWGFDPGRVALMSDEDLDRLVSDTRIIRNGQKISAVQTNASFICDLAREHGSAAAFFADWPDDDFIGLLDVLKKRGKRLGGMTGPYFLRTMGKDSFMINDDTSIALVRAGVVDKKPTSKAALTKVQQAFNEWSQESGRPMAHISKTLACSVDG
ncbi:MAG: DNA-3-methyladenine glycosylase I [Rhodospirillales bacterium]|nr:DNA-3-methyladenine glycosylase I [Rhodospirillales bacterium]